VNPDAQPIAGLKEALTRIRATPPDPDLVSLIESLGNQWTIGLPLATLLHGLVTALGRRSILEFGAGLSSVVLARALSISGGGRLTSIEHQPEYCRDLWDDVARRTGVDSALIVSRLRMRLSRHGLMYGYPDARSPIARRGPYDLLVIDAPPGQFGRDWPLYEVCAHLTPGALIVLDDFERIPERTTVRRWLETFPALQVLAADVGWGRGTALLYYSGDQRRRVAPRAIVGTFHDRWVTTRRWAHARVGRVGTR
jgi:predicted O-methyltransferase YrrM